MGRPKDLRQPFAVTVLLVALTVAGCGIDQERTALAIQHTSRGLTMTDDPLRLRFRVVVECAEDVTVTVGRDHGGGALPEVTVWGRPTIGRCQSTAEVTVPGLPGKIVDGATSQVVEIGEPT